MLSSAELRFSRRRTSPLRWFATFQSSTAQAQAHSEPSGQTTSSALRSLSAQTCRLSPKLGPCTLVKNQANNLKKRKKEIKSRKTDTMKRSVYSGNLKKGGRYTAVANANAPLSQKQQALEREWGNAFQTLNASNKQEEVKFVQSPRTEAPDYPANYDAWQTGIWELNTLPPNVPLMTQSGDPPVYVSGIRAGRSINVTALDWTTKVEIPVTGLDITEAPQCYQATIREIVFVDTQQNDFTTENATLPLLLQLEGNDADATHQINAFFNLDNQKRFKILSDEILTVPQKALFNETVSLTAKMRHTWIRHLDLNLIQTWKASDTLGKPDDIVTNPIYFARCCESSVASAEPAKYWYSIQTSFTDC